MDAVQSQEVRSGGATDTPSRARDGRRARFGPCQEYRQSLATLSRIDVWLALAMTVAEYLNTFAWGAWYATGQHTDGAALTRGVIDIAVLLVVVGITLAARRQPWSTVGFGTRKLRLSLQVGVWIVAVCLGASWLVSFAVGGPWNDPRLLTFALPFYLGPIAFFEELIFRGFITTRLAATFRRQWIGVVVGGLIFALSHLVGSLPYGGDLGSVLASSWWRVLIPLAWHFVLWWLYARYNSLIAPTLLHLCMNMSGVIVGTMA